MNFYTQVNGYFYHLINSGSVNDSVSNSDACLFTGKGVKEELSGFKVPS
jgi:hypothetical protein